MSRLYSSPLRVYLCLGLLALVGVYSGLKLPISLFPNSSKPTIWVSLHYGSGTADEFLNAYGKTLENLLVSVSVDDVKPVLLQSNYRDQSVSYKVEFGWGASPTAALEAVESKVQSFGHSQPATASHHL